MKGIIVTICVLLFTTHARAQSNDDKNNRLNIFGSIPIVYYNPKDLPDLKKFPFNSTFINPVVDTTYTKEKTEMMIRRIFETDTTEIHKLIIIK